MRTSKSEIARRADVTRRTLYTWIEEPEAVLPKTAQRITFTIAKLGVTREKLRVGTRAAGKSPQLGKSGQKI